MTIVQVREEFMAIMVLLEQARTAGTLNMQRKIEESLERGNKLIKEEWQYEQKS